MLDIETLDTKQSAVILSIAMVEFYPNDNSGATQIAHVFPSVTDQIKEGRTTSGDTAIWWMTQDTTAQLQMIEGRRRFEANGMPLDSIRDIIIANVMNADAIWAKGPDFDCKIVEDFLGTKFRWPFWKNRCVRTLNSVYPEYAQMASIEGLVKHNAVDDCHIQIAQIQSIYKNAKIIDL